MVYFFYRIISYLELCMWGVIKREWTAKVIVSFFVLYTLLWLYLTFFMERDSYLHVLFTNTYGLVALFGGVLGILISKKWGGYKSVIGRAILFFGFGLLAQVFGQLSYFVYIYYVGVDVPYPSIGDIGFFGQIPLYLYGIIQLGKASGAQVRLRSFGSQIQAVAIPAVVLVASYMFFLRGYEFDWTNPLIVFLDFAYPLGQALNVALAILVFSLSRKMLGGFMRNKILLFIFAFVAQYLADYVFLYQAYQGTWYVSGFNDFMYFFAYFIMTFSIIQLADAYKRRASEAVTE